MVSFVSPYGQATVSIPASQKIAVFSYTECSVYSTVGYPNVPPTQRLDFTSPAGSQTVSSAYTAATSVEVVAGAAPVYYEVGAAPSISEPVSDISAADATFTITGLAAAQGGYVSVIGGTSSTSGNAGGAASITGGQPGATGVGGAASVIGGAGGATSGAGGVASITGGAGTAGNANGGNVVIAAGAANGSGVGGQIITRSLQGRTQVTPTAKTTTATLTIAELKTGLLTGTHAAGATQTYTLPTGTLVDAALQFSNDDSFDWYLINLSAAALDTITLAAGTDHTIVGNVIVQSSHATTGVLYGNTAHLRTRKTATNTYVTYRIA